MGFISEIIFVNKKEEGLVNGRKLRDYLVLKYISH